MHTRIDIGSWRWYMAITRSKKILGVNSNLADGNHTLMWDFDNVDLPTIRATLARLQHQWDLPAVHILQSSLPDNYHAYCFARRSWPVTLNILASTEHLDQQYFKIGVIRGYFTLRFVDKKDGKIDKVDTLASPWPDEANPENMTSFESYWTKRL